MKTSDRLGRRASPADLELVADGFDFPSSLTIDGDGSLYVAESGVPFGTTHAGRVWRLDGSHRELIADGLKGPVNGVCWFENILYVAEAGPPGRILSIDAAGRQSTLLDGLPGPGNYHTNMPVIGPDRKLYFSQGAMTNTAVVGLDSYEIGWLRRLPHAHDVPGLPVTLIGTNFITTDPRNGSLPAGTGAFMAYGESSSPGQRLDACLPCTAAVMRCDLDGGNLELVAWGLRNAYGLCFLQDGRLLAIDQGADDRGSRPVGNAPDLLYEVLQGRWYGWPDFIGGVPISDAAFLPERGEPPDFVLADHQALPPLAPPLFLFPPHSAATRLAEVEDRLLVALFGDERPMTAPEGQRVGRCVVEVDLSAQLMKVVASEGLQRPIDIIGAGDGTVLVLDFGRFEMTGSRTVDARTETGAVWRLSSY